MVNLGIGHGAADGGAGYTYFDPNAGHEFSVVTGLTYNLLNPSTGYQNGIDWHVDWGASQFLTKQLLVGAVGYVYQQITPDNGCNPALCPFESRVIGIGPQIGYIFPAGNLQGYVNLKAYWEFAAQDRPSGWNTCCLLYTSQRISSRSCYSLFALDAVPGRRTYNGTPPRGHRGAPVANK